MRLLIVRHAEPGPDGRLTPAGHREAAALAERLAGAGIDVLYSSPLERALQTAEYTARRIGRDPAIEPWTRELPGGAVTITPWGMMSAMNVPGEVLRGLESYPPHDDWHAFPHFDQEDLRSWFAEVGAGSDAFLARHGYAREGRRYRRVAPNRDRVAVFCHLGFGLAWIAHLLDLPLPLVWAGFWLPPSSVTTLVFEERSATWAVPRCLALGDTAHLHAAGLPISGTGLKVQEA